MLDFNIPSLPGPNPLVPYVNIQSEPEDEAASVSYLGTPVYSNITFKADGISSIGNPNSLNPDEGKRDLVLDSAIITVDRANVVVMTPIAGRDGRVKEFISNDDYMVTITGVITSPYPNVFPEDDVILLRQFADAKQEIAVLSRFLGMFLIENLVLLQVKVSELEGYYNTVRVDISAISDKPYEIEL